ncbi:MAG: gamma-butyrobetaine hydroxylase-like domain-containing protein [Polyangiaceae bacterium]
MTNFPFAHALELTLPDWTRERLAAETAPRESLEARMQLTIEAARLNFERDSGGPFAAAVFEAESGRLVSLGVNRVVPHSCSSAHAEVMALSLAQQRLRTFDLSAPGLPEHQLVVNWRPCAMCFGAIPWSGVRSLVIAGGGPAIEELTGFDEGPNPSRLAGRTRAPRHPRDPRSARERGLEGIRGLRPERAPRLQRPPRLATPPMEARYQPTRVKAPHGAFNLELSWADGHHSTFPHEILRGYCPCAGCQGHSGTIKFQSGCNLELRNLEQVGNYALSFTWGDGHEAGIYTFRYLRALGDMLDAEGAEAVKALGELPRV